jgi:hypothetical protein
MDGISSLLWMKHIFVTPGLSISGVIHQGNQKIIPFIVKTMRKEQRKKIS